MVCLGVIMKHRQWGEPGPIGAVTPGGGGNMCKPDKAINLDFLFIEGLSVCYPSNRR